MMPAKCRKREQQVEREYMEVKPDNREDAVNFCGEYQRILRYVLPGDILVRSREAGRVYVYTAEQFRKIFERVIE